MTRIVSKKQIEKFPLVHSRSFFRPFLAFSANQKSSFCQNTQTAVIGVFSSFSEKMLPKIMLFRDRQFSKIKLVIGDYAVCKQRC